MRRALLIVAALLMPACTTSDDTEPVVYVAVGASDTTGVGLLDPTREAWPHVFRHAVLPEDAEYTTVGVSGSTVEAALKAQVPKALEWQPTLVTVWLNVNDLTRFVPAASYEAQLRELVRRLRRGGRTTVLVANTPKLDQLPAVARLGLSADVVKAAVAGYNAVIDRVVRDEGAVLVDLHAEPFDPSYVGTDGFHPSAAGHKAIAAVFAAAYERTAAVTTR